MRGVIIRENTMGKKIGIIGAGVMGKGVAERFSKYGYDIVLIDNNSEVLNNAISEISRSIRMKAV
ncbi:3-hydroxyacyl-CoA dehydrogenase NAD-binding domain-containing protein [Butyrivibrio sp. MC2021]|uniref:3-hydroxyacyl-CoA dehydrogenase NAD-binding domain-containing protein n=1 Tax=Butyrivibrio sp. MC2021 TaxID=1408306 RepID=UPI002E8DDF44|nr:3-hydroxyacyl-CoA dehydrogenase NAD-binding domain-containing protein [Butyrivibrio sp. MC2021]